MTVSVLPVISRPVTGGVMRTIDVALVDDEMIVLEDLKTLIDWEANGVAHLYTARNAAQAMKILESHHVDVIFMDILLSGTDGLTLSEKIRGICPDVQIVILSAYKEFNYAARGIELGVYRYMLKHELTAERLADTLRELREKTELLRAEQRMKEQQYLYSLVTHGFVFGGSGASSDGLLNRQIWLGAVFTLPSFDRSGRAEENLRISISGLLDPQVEGMTVSHILPLSDRLLVLADGIGGHALTFQVLLEKIVAILQADTGIPVKAMYYALPVTPGRLKELNETLTLQMPAAMFYKNKNCISLTDVRPDSEVQNNGSLQDSTGETGDSPEEGIRYGTAEEEGEKDREEDLWESLRRAAARKDAGAFCRICSEMLQTDQNLKDAVDGPVYYAEDILRAMEKARTRASKAASPDISPMTRYVLRYIEEHYRDNITLQDIADQLNANGMYLGQCFIKDMKVNFRSYLNEYRIRKAMKLLTGSNLKMFEISEKVGIMNGQYFSRLFKAQTGMSPHEYRKRHFQAF